MTTGAWQISESTTEILRLQNQLVGYFAKRLGKHEDPRDYAADVWVAAGKGFERRSSLRYYLFAIARRVVADYWRRVSRRPELVEVEEELPSDQSGCETALQRLANHATTQRALKKVDYPHQDVVRLWLRGRDPLEIADELGIPYNTARSRIGRGRLQLIELLVAEYEESADDVAS